MIVWGGKYLDLLKDGGRYHPATDSWLALSLTSAPSARRWHTAVWTGSEMIVWGGEGGGTTGGRYNPVTDGWSPVNLTNAPAERIGHTAVWTGSGMIVWGGYNSGVLNEGGRYTPASDTWTAVTTAGAPVARVDHTAVWTGREMIVWGGAGDGIGNYRNDGARYDPLLNTWTAVIPTGSPDGRYLHSAVWTGSGMIIWGGSVPGDQSRGSVNTFCYSPPRTLYLFQRP
jgi:N-acetylneuraminic acid mutarotase